MSDMGSMIKDSVGIGKDAEPQIRAGIGRAEGAISTRLEQSPMFNYNWYVSLPSLMPPPQAACPFPNTGADIDGTPLALRDEVIMLLTPDLHKLNIRVTSVEVPVISYEPMKNTIGSRTFYTAGRGDMGTITMTIDEMEDGFTLRYLMAWMDIIGNEKAVVNAMDAGDSYSVAMGKVGYHNAPACYKRSIIVGKTASSGLDTHMSELKGCFPISIGNISHNYEDAGITAYSVTFAIDDVIHEFYSEAEVKDLTNRMQSGITGKKNKAGLYEQYGSSLDTAKKLVGAAMAFSSL